MLQDDLVVTVDFISVLLKSDLWLLFLRVNTFLFPIFTHGLFTELAAILQNSNAVILCSNVHSFHVSHVLTFSDIAIFLLINDAS